MRASPPLMRILPTLLEAFTLLACLSAPLSAQITPDYSLHEKLIKAFLNADACHHNIHLVLMLDNSGSVSRNSVKTDVITGAWSKICDNFLQPGDKVTVIPYSSSVEEATSIEFTDDEERRNRIRGMIEKGQSPKDGTICYLAREALLEKAIAETTDTKRVVVALQVTDYGNTDIVGLEAAEATAANRCKELIRTFRRTTDSSAEATSIGKNEERTAGGNIYFYYAVEGETNNKEVVETPRAYAPTPGSSPASFSIAEEPTSPAAYFLGGLLLLAIGILLPHLFPSQVRITLDDGETTQKQDTSLNNRETLEISLQHGSDLPPKNKIWFTCKEERTEIKRIARLRPLFWGGWEIEGLNVPLSRNNTEIRGRTALPKSQTSRLEFIVEQQKRYTLILKPEPWRKGKFLVPFYTLAAIGAGLLLYGFSLSNQEKEVPLSFPSTSRSVCQRLPLPSHSALLKKELAKC